MLGFISKKKLKAYMTKVKDGNRASNLGANTDYPVSEDQQRKNTYAQGYEDGTDNFYNGICSQFNI